MTAVNDSNESYSLLVIITFFSTLFLSLIICAIVGAIIISYHKKQEVETQKGLNNFEFVEGLEPNDDTGEENDLNLYEFIDSDLDESDDREYAKIIYDELNAGGNVTVEYLQIFE
jgi:hypothetical protein